MHRFGVFDFCNMQSAPSVNQVKYYSELSRDCYTAGGLFGNVVPTPWYNPADTTAESLLLYEEMLQFIIVFVTEMPGYVKVGDEVDAVKAKLRREVVHRLASGSCTHSSLTDVHSMLSIWENNVLQDGGTDSNMLLSTGGEGLDEILADVALRKTGKDLEPDTWDLKDTKWCEYDPSFYHLTSKSHQLATENRATAMSKKWKGEVKSESWCPPPVPCHPYFVKLRKYILADAAVRSFLWCTIHDHFGSCPSDGTDQQRSSLHRSERQMRQSETALGRAVHLLTLGCYLWSTGEENLDCVEGSFWVTEAFADRTTSNWVRSMFLSSGEECTSAAADAEKECILKMLLTVTSKKEERSTDGCNTFKPSDVALLGAISWIVDFCALHNSEARGIVGKTESLGEGKGTGESVLEKRKREARERALKSMSMQASKFMVDMEECLSDDEFGGVMGGSEDRAEMNVDVDHEGTSCGFRFLGEPTKCIICNDDAVQDALGWCCLIQPSTVGMGGAEWTPKASDSEVISNRLVNAHVSLCGHAVHKKCFKSYIGSTHLNRASLDSRDGEFYCPLCKGFSNALVPVVEEVLEEKEGRTTTSSSSPSVGLGLVETELVLEVEEVEQGWRQGFKINRNRVDKDSVDSSVGMLRDFFTVLNSQKIKADEKRLGMKELSQDYGAYRNYSADVEMFSMDAEDDGGRQYVGLGADDFRAQNMSLVRSETSESKKKSKVLGLQEFSRWVEVVSSFVYTIVTEEMEVRRVLLESGRGRINGVEGLWLKNKLVVLKSIGGGNFNTLRGLAGMLKLSGSLYFPMVLSHMLCHVDHKSKRFGPPLLESEIVVIAVCAILSRLGECRVKESWEGMEREIMEAVAKCFVGRLAQVLLGYIFKGGAETLRAGQVTNIEAAISKIRGRQMGDPDGAGKFLELSLGVLSLCLGAVKRRLAREEKDGVGMDVDAGDAGGAVEEDFILEGVYCASKLCLEFFADICLVLQVAWPEWMDKVGEIPDDEDVHAGEVIAHSHSTIVVKVMAWMGCKKYMPFVGEGNATDYVNSWVGEINGFENVKSYSWSGGAASFRDLCHRKTVDASRLTNHNDTGEGSIGSTEYFLGSFGAAAGTSSPARTRSRDRSGSFPSPSSPSYINTRNNTITAFKESGGYQLLGWNMKVKRDWDGKWISCIPASYADLYASLSAMVRARCAFACICACVRNAGEGGGSNQSQFHFVQEQFVRLLTLTNANSYRACVRTCLYAWIARTSSVP